jgi:hypothetical protein
VEVARLFDRHLLREVGDLEDIDFSLELRDLVVELVAALGQRSVLCPETCFVDHSRLVEVVELVDLDSDLLSILLKDGEEFGLGFDRLVGLDQVRSYLLVGEEEVLDLVMKYRLKVVERDLVPAFLAGVLRVVRGYVHLLAAGAVRKAGEEVGGGPGGTLPPIALLVQVEVALDPEFLRDDRFDFKEHPLGFRLEDPGALAPVGALRVVGAANTLGDGVAQEPVDGGVGELAALPGPVPPLIEHASDLLFPLAVTEELEHELAYRRLLGVNEKFLVLPLVAVGGLAAGRLASLGTDWDCGRDTLGDLLTLPLGHRRDHGVEEAAGGA